MAKTSKKPAEAQGAETGLIIKAEFQSPAAFALPDKEASLKIIAAKKKEYSQLAINGVEDKDGYEAVKTAMAEMKNTRIALAKAAKENVIDKAAKILKDFMDDLAELTDALSSVEDDLRAKKDAIDDEKERIKAEKAAEKAKAIQVRINDLNVLGAIFDGQIYSFPYDGGLIINVLQLNDFDDEEFGEFLEDVKTAFAEEQTRLTELKLQEEKDEAERLAEIERNKELAAENVEKEKQLAKDKWDLLRRIASVRCKELKMLGFEPNGLGMFLKGGNPFEIHSLTIENSTDEEWEALINEIENYVEPEKPAATDIAADFQDAGITDIEFEEAPAAVASDIALGDHVSELDEHLRSTGFVECKLIFDINEPFIDVDISGKLLMRIYPDDFIDQATAGIETIANNGRIQDRLNWIILSKSQAVVVEPFKVSVERDTYNPEV